MSLAFAAAASRLGPVKPHRFRGARTGALAVLALAASSGCADLLPLRGTVTVQPGAAALCVGDSLAFTAQVLDSSGHLVSSPQLLWSSSAPQVASVDPSSGMAHALSTGSTQITAASGGGRSAPAALAVPADLVPEFVPDSVVLAPGDTMTLGVRLRRRSTGPVPNRTPVIAPFDSSVASLNAAGLVTAKVAGRAGLSLAACGQQGGGAVDVFTPPDSVTGLAYLWLSGAKELRVRLPVRALNFTRTGGGPAFQVVGPVNNTTRFFLYEDTVPLTGPGAYALDSLKSSEVTQVLACQPPRPFAMYTDQANVSQLTQLFGLHGAAAQLTSFAPQNGYKAVSGRLVFRMRGEVSGQLGPGGGADTLAAIYTFSAPLVSWAGVCP